MQHYTTMLIFVALACRPVTSENIFFFRLKEERSEQNEAILEAHRVKNYLVLGDITVY